MSKKKKNTEKKQDAFQVDNGSSKVQDDLKVTDSQDELRSHSDGTGPQPVEPPAKKKKKEKPVKEPKPVQAIDPERQAMKAHKKRNRRKGHKNAWFFRGVWLCVIVLLGIGIAVFCVTCLNDMLGFQKSHDKVTIELKKGASTEEIADVLADNGIIKNKWAFCTYSNVTNSDGNYEYGTFELTPDMDYQGLINALQASSSRVDTVSITFTEGTQITQMAAQLEKAGVCTAEEFENVCKDKELFKKYECISDIQNKDGRAYFLEGYLFPDTYEFYKDEGAENAAEKMVANTVNKLTAEHYKKAEKLGMSMDDVLILASMIQKEAADKTDMYNVSAVFHNRLKAGAAGGFAYLNSDPTAWYPYQTADKVPDGYDSEYNTNTHVGLPIGPICNPGMSAIEAALEPNDNDYYYFCHSKEGVPYYAENEWEHQNNLVTAGVA